MAVNAQGIVHMDVLDGNCNKQAFVNFLKTLPVPAGTTLLMDNVQFHHSKETLETIKHKQCMPLFIPPYSPRFNAIEQVFAAVKAKYRKHCPLAPSIVFDYEGAVLAASFECAANGFRSYFEHTRKVVQCSLAAAQRGDRVSGYD